MQYTVITGASSGIGKALANRFAEKGHNLILTARRGELLEAVKADIDAKHDVSVLVRTADLGNMGDVRSFYDFTRQYDLECFINNAGLGDFSYPWEMPVEKAGHMIDVNIKALTTLSLSFVQDYHDKQAQLINVASIGGYLLIPSATTYCATKFYVSSFTEGLAMNLREHGKSLSAKVLAPGGTKTEFFSQADVGAGSHRNTVDTSGFMPAGEIARHAYTLYESDKTVGVVNHDGFELTDAVHGVMTPEYHISPAT